MRKERKHFTPEEKVAILRRHLLDKVPVSELCEELGLRPTVFYRWHKELFENAAAAFQSQRFTLSATASWKPPNSNVSVAASKLREERKGQPPRCRIAVNCRFRIADNPIAGRVRKPKPLRLRWPAASTVVRSRPSRRATELATVQPCLSGKRRVPHGPRLRGTGTAQNC